MAINHGKIPATCPKCGHVQQEPQGLISTYCRGCGEYYSVADAARVAKAQQSRHGLVAKLHDKLVSARQIAVHCYECASDHEVSSYATSTFCPGCGVHIDLEDIAIDRHVTLPVNTRGLLHVGKGGFLNAGRAVCREAWIEGRFSGGLVCELLLRFSGKGVVRGQVKARKIDIERGADAEFEHPLVAGEIHIDGSVRCDIACEGSLVVGKHGVLLGDIQARSLVVEKGGVLSGSVRVTPATERKAQPDVEPLFYSDLRPLPFFGENHVAFGS